MRKPHRLVRFAGAVGQRLADDANPLADHCCVDAGPEHARLGAIGHGDLDPGQQPRRRGWSPPDSAGSRPPPPPADRDWSRDRAGEHPRAGSAARLRVPTGRWSGPERPMLGTRPAAQHRRPAAGRRVVAAGSGRRAASRCRRASPDGPTYAPPAAITGTIPRLIVEPASADRAWVRESSVGGSDGAEQQRDPQRVVDGSVQTRCRRARGPRRAWSGRGSMSSSLRRLTALGGVQLAVVVDAAPRDGLASRLLDHRQALDRQHVEAGSVRNATGPARTSRPSSRVTVASGPRSLRSSTMPVAEAAGAQRDPEQGEELRPVALRDLVGAVDQRLGQEGEQLEQRDARVAVVEVGPLRVVDRDPGQRLVDEVLVAAGLDDRRGWSSHAPEPYGQVDRCSGVGGDEPVA